VRLASFSIKNYKIIDDTGTVKVEPLVTSLVGKNESGKSAVMRAMWKSKNVANAVFDKLLDFPRDRYSRERKQTQEVTRLEFLLSENEREELMDTLPSDAGSGPTTATLVTYYDGEDKTKSEILCDWDISGCPTGQTARRAIEAVRTAASTTGAVDAPLADWLDNLEDDAWSWSQENLATLNAANTSITQWASKEEARKGVATTERAALVELINRSKEGDPRIKAIEWLKKNLPTFIYFDQYGTLRTRIHLPTYISRKATSDVDVRTQTALFEWSSLDPAEISALGRPRADNETEEQVHRRHEKRRALLDSASFSLTGDWLKWWPGGDHKLVFDVDGEFLVLNVADSKSPFPIPFEERSQGFQWFFSFYLVFLVESGKSHKGAVLLLDEPGLHLHPTMQMRLVSFFERVATDNQLIYSTHLPFLVDGNNLQRVRTVYLTEDAPPKTRVSANVRPAGDKDTLFPLQAALGYSIAQTLFLGKRTAIVEGVTDFWVIKALDAVISAAGKGEGLSEDIVLIPAGGTSRLMPLASVMLASMAGIEGSMLVVLDSDTEGSQAAKRLEDAFEQEATVLMLGTAIGRTEATIEDLVPRETYLDAVKRWGRSVKLNAAEAKESLTAHAVEAAFKRLSYGNFGAAERAAVMLVLLDDWGKDPKRIPPETMTAGKALIAAIKQHFAK
jgi:hypothetical protein